MPTKLTRQNLGGAAAMTAPALWVYIAFSLSTVARADPPRKPTPAEVKREQERKRAERERAIQECTDDRDGDPDADREVCEDQVSR